MEGKSFWWKHFGKVFGGKLCASNVLAGKVFGGKNILQENLWREKVFGGNILGKFLAGNFVVGNLWAGNILGLVSSLATNKKLSKVSTCADMDLANCGRPPGPAVSLDLQADPPVAPRVFYVALES